MSRSFILILLLSLFVSGDIYGKAPRRVYQPVRQSPYGVPRRPKCRDGVLDYERNMEKKLKMDWRYSPCYERERQYQRQTRKLIKRENRERRREYNRSRYRNGERIHNVCTSMPNDLIVYLNRFLYNDYVSRCRSGVYGGGPEANNFHYLNYLYVRRRSGGDSAEVAACNEEIRKCERFLDRRLVDAVMENNSFYLRNPPFYSFP